MCITAPALRAPVAKVAAERPPLDLNLSAPEVMDEARG